jgi:hypothetical protein
MAILLTTPVILLSSIGSIAGVAVLVISLVRLLVSTFSHSPAIISSHFTKHLTLPRRSRALLATLRTMRFYIPWPRFPVQGCTVLGIYRIW